MDDFVPGGLFVRPHFDERYWSTFGYPARVRVEMWGGELARGIAYQNHGPVTDGQKGAVRKISSGRKARGYASGTDR